ncbi:hypothetical protein Tco_1234859 [Tanacetum coccineum]
MSTTTSSTTISLAPRIDPHILEQAMRQKELHHHPPYHSLLPSGTPPLLPIPLPSTSRRADISEADTPPRKRLLLTTPRPGCEIGESSAAATARQPGPTIETRLLDTERRMMTALELVNRRITYQVDVCTRESSEFCTRQRHCPEGSSKPTIEATSYSVRRLRRFAMSCSCRLHMTLLFTYHAYPGPGGWTRIDALDDTGRSSKTLVYDCINYTKMASRGRPTRTYDVKASNLPNCHGMIDEGSLAVLEQHCCKPGMATIAIPQKLVEEGNERTCGSAPIKTS